MGRDWESVFKSWGKAPSETESQKCMNSENMIKDAIRTSNIFKNRNIRVFAQGSYRGNTNVRNDSDVDICVLCYDTFYYDLSFADGLTKDKAGILEATYSYSQYKDEIEKALIEKFGRKSVTRGNKAFDIHENAYRVDADVVPCFEQRRYSGQKKGSDYEYISGTTFIPDNGGRIENWPEQNYENGVEKNKATGLRYKTIIRILKKLKYEMIDNGIDSAQNAPSFLIESLVWNVPNEDFGHDSLVEDVRYTLAHTFNNTLASDLCQEWGEVNELKYLFSNGQPWTLNDAHGFLSDAWDYIGFD